MEELIEAVVRMLEEELGGTVKVVTTEVAKVNDTKLHGISIVPEGQSIGNVYYMESYYPGFLSGRESIRDIVEQILNNYYDTENIIGDVAGNIISDIRCYEKVKNQIFVKLLSKERNQKYLADKVYVDYLDLAVCFAIYTGELVNGCVSSVDVTEEIFQRWNMSKEELYEWTVKNTRKLWTERFVDVVERLKQYAEEDESIELLEDSTLYMLTNASGIDGAAAVLYENVLKDFADSMGVSRLYLLPSSRHEFLIIPSDRALCIEWFTRLVREVNATVLEAEDYLSDHAYVYDRETDTVSY